MKTKICDVLIASTLIQITTNKSFKKLYQNSETKDFANFPFFAILFL